jgi:hypothetical protein
MQRLSFDTWEELRGFLDEPPSGGVRFTWRGQRDPHWPLASSLERRLLSLCGATPGGPRSLGAARYRSMVAEHLERWKKASSGLRGPTPKDLSEEQWWALGRHYGLMTPMLDWTEKPYVALFFALRGAAPLFGDEVGGTPGARFAMYRLADCARLADDSLKVVRTPIDELGRMQQQRGLFTWIRSEEHFDLGELLEATGRGDLLTQALVAADVIPRALHDLDLHGIDHRLLFPDLYGAAGYANAQLSLDGLLDPTRPGCENDMTDR